MRKIGYLGIGPYKSSVDKVATKEYKIWTRMLERCYNSNYHIKKPTYKGCTVHESWMNFQVFAQWYTENYVEGFALDKDILIGGNKEYGPNTCAFVPSEINNLIVSNKATRGDLPVGVVRHEGRFRARVSKDSVFKSLGVFDTPELAFQAYKIAKEQQIKVIAAKYKLQISERVYQALNDYKVELSD